MQISFNPAINYNRNRQIKYTAQNPIQNNPDKISFQGQRPPQINHEFSEILGKQYQIRYDALNGSLSQQVRTRKGQLISEEQYNHADGTQKITQINKKTGIKTVTENSPEKHSVKRYNAEGQEEYSYTRNRTGEFEEQITDYKLGRKIVTKGQGKYSEKHIYDINSNEEVYIGPLVSDTIYDDATGTYTTINILTKRVLRREKYKPNGDLIFDRYYSPVTGHITKETSYDSSRKSYIENTYTQIPNNNVISKTTVRSKNGKNYLEIKYNPDGSIKEKTGRVEHPSKDFVLGVYEYYPERQDRINTAYLYNLTGFVVRQYRREPNVKAIEDIYDENKTLRKSIIYQADGKKFKEIKQYDKDGFLRALNEYDKHGNLVKRTLYKVYSTDYKEEYYNELEERTYSTVKDIDGKIIEYTTYHTGGKTPKMTKSYDRIFNVLTVYQFDKSGKVIKKESFDRN